MPDSVVYIAGFEFVMVTQPDLYGIDNFNLYTAPTPSGPWTAWSGNGQYETPTDREASGRYCYAIVIPPEYSTSTVLARSFYDTDWETIQGTSIGHVEIAGVPFPSG